MNNRRQFLGSLLGLAPTAIIGRQIKVSEPLPRRIETVRIADDGFRKAVVKAFMDDYNGNGTTRMRELVRHDGDAACDCHA